MALEAFPERRCSGCTTQKQKQWGCDSDLLHPLKFDGEELYRCPLRPYKENPHHFSELFKQYAYREKSILPEVGGLYDQPAYYIDAMLEMDSAVSDRAEVKEKTNKEKLKSEEDKVDKLRTLGFNIVKRNP